MLPSVKQKDIRCNIAICPVNVLVAATPFSIPKDKLILSLVFLTNLESILLTIDRESLKNSLLDSSKSHVSAVSPDCEIKIYNTFLRF